MIIQGLTYSPSAIQGSSSADPCLTEPVVFVCHDIQPAVIAYSYFSEPFELADGTLLTVYEAPFARFAIVTFFARGWDYDEEGHKHRSIGGYNVKDENGVPVPSLSLIIVWYMTETDTEAIMERVWTVDAILPPSYGV